MIKMFIQICFIYCLNVLAISCPHALGDDITPKSVICIIMIHLYLILLIFSISMKNLCSEYTLRDRGRLAMLAGCSLRQATTCNSRLKFQSSEYYTVKVKATV